MQLRGRPPLGRQKWEHAITTLREKRNWPGQDEDEDDPIVGCQQLQGVPTSLFANSPSNFEAFEAIFKARFAL